MAKRFNCPMGPCPVPSAPKVSLLFFRIIPLASKTHTFFPHSAQTHAPMCQADGRDLETKPHSFLPQAPGKTKEGHGPGNSTPQFQADSSAQP